MKTRTILVYHGVYRFGKFVKSQEISPIFPRSLKKTKNELGNFFYLILVQRSLESCSTNKNSALNSVSAPLSINTCRGIEMLVPRHV